MGGETAVPRAPRAGGRDLDGGRITADGVLDYLARRGRVPVGPDPRIAELSGGISNVVLAVSWPDGGVVVKQSLPELQVAEPWEFDRRRAVVEAACLAELGARLEPGEVPALVDIDRDALAFTMSLAPAGGRAGPEPVS